jgi:hypothetical protein
VTSCFAEEQGDDEGHESKDNRDFDLYSLTEKTNRIVMDIASGIKPQVGLIASDTPTAVIHRAVFNPGRWRYGRKFGSDETKC